MNRFNNNYDGGSWCDKTCEIKIMHIINRSANLWHFYYASFGVLRFCSVIMKVIEQFDNLYRFLDQWTRFTGVLGELKFDQILLRFEVPTFVLQFSKLNFFWLCFVVC